MARKTISKYLERLITKGLIVEVQKAHGSRPGRIDVSRHYDELIVPNQREQRAAAKQKAAGADEPSLDTGCVSSESSLSQMTRPTRENSDLGGIEAIEEEKVQDAQSDADDLRQLYESAVERWKETRIREFFDAAIRDHGLDPNGSWWVEAEITGTETNSARCWNLLLPASKTSDVKQDPRPSCHVAAVTGHARSGRPTIQTREDLDLLASSFELCCAGSRLHDPRFSCVVVQWFG